jgi:RND superfamily putative drug exporter
MKTTLTERLARSAATHPKKTIAAWSALLAVCVAAVALLLGGALTTNTQYRFSQPDSVKGQLLMEKDLAGPAKATEFVIVRSHEGTVTDPGFRAYVAELSARIRALGPKVVAGTASVYETKNPAFVSKDGKATLIAVTMAGNEATASGYVDRLHRMVLAGERDGYTLQQTGGASLTQAGMQLAKSDMARSEKFGMPAALIILLLVFGAVVAAGMPLLLAGIAILMALALTALAGTVYDVSAFALNVITMMGLAVGVDYSLFIISRYREERARGLAKIDAIARTGATAGRAIMFSGLTVMIAMLGMVVAPVDVTISMGLGAILVVLTALGTGLVFLPAMLGLLGDRVNALRLPFLGRRRRTTGDDSEGSATGSGRSLWERLAYSIMRRPLPYLLIAVAFLIACAAPTFSMNTGNLTAGGGAMPDHLYAKQGWITLDRDFTLGAANPVQIVIDCDAAAPAVKAATAQLRASLASDGRFGPSQVQASRSGDLTLVVTTLAGDPAGAADQRAVKDLRTELVPAAFEKSGAKVYVTGASGFAVDYLGFFDRWLPIAIAVVLALSFCLMLLAFRSLVIAAKTIVMNLLSVGAAYGLMVLVFQQGVGASLFGFAQVDRIEAWVPLVMFSMLFGLSMDYQVFLLSRIKERYDQTGDTRGAVAYGISRTAGIITGAAAIMVVVFAGVASGELVMFQQMGFGLAIAILLDATIVRTIVMPAAMELLGDWNWYLPRWLEWLPNISIEGAPAEAPLDGTDERGRVDEPGRTPRTGGWVVDRPAFRLGPSVYRPLPGVVTAGK